MADNWIECPECDSEKAIEENDMVNLLQKDYGKISQENYAQRQQEVKEFLREELGETLREDYEYYLDVVKGVLSVSYSCRCQECGWGFDYNEDVDYSSFATIKKDLIR